MAYMSRIIRFGIKIADQTMGFGGIGRKAKVDRERARAEVGYKGVQLVTISRPTAYGEYAPYHFVDTEQEFQTLVKGLRP